MPNAGFSDEEVDDYRQKSMDSMAHAGFSTDEIQKYYGAKQPDMSDTKAHVQRNVSEANKNASGEAKPKREPIDMATQPVEAKDILDGLAAGWGSSFSSLFATSQKSPIAVAENAGRATKIASMVGQLAGDVPAMAAGAIGGAGFGTIEAPVVGTIGMATAGAFAAPAAMRKMLVDQIEKGDIKSTGDFTDRLAAASWEGIKGAITGLATEITGGGYNGTVSKMAAEASTMAFVSSGLEGHLPSVDDFTNGALLVAGLHGVSTALPKMHEIYAKTGLKPEDVAEKAATDPVLKQEIVAAGNDFPKSLEPLVEKGAETPTEETKETPTEQPDEIQAANDKVRSQIQEKEPQTKSGYGFKDFYQDYVDKLDPVKNATDKLNEGQGELPTAEDPYKLARMANDSTAKAKHAFEFGTMDFKTLATNGKGLKEIMAPISGDLENFENYIVSKRALELEGQGRKSGFDVDAAKAVADEGDKNPKFQKAQAELVEFQNRNLKYLYDSGRIDRKAMMQMLDMGKEYVPFARILDPEMFSEVKPGGKSSPLKRLKGSDLAIQSPLESVLDNTQMIFKWAEMNRAKTSLIDLAEKSGNTDYFTKVPGNKMKAVDAAPEVNKLLEDIGVDFNVDEFKVFRSQEKGLTDNQFEMYRDGKREVYQIEDTRIAKALKTLDGNPGTQNLFMKAARFMTAMKRVGTTMVPDFILKNFIRDQMTAGTFSKYGTLPFGDVFKAMGDVFNENEHFQNWLKSGGANGAFLDLNSKYLEKDIFGLDKETGFIQNVQNVIKTPSDMQAVAKLFSEAPKQFFHSLVAPIEKYGNIIESGPRLAEFKRVSQGATEGNKLFEGGFESREITVDFQRMGAKTQAMNSITAFMNAQVQGLDRTARALKDDPLGTTTKGLAYMTAPTIALWMAQKDDPRYQEIPQWEKDLFWCFVHHDWQAAQGTEADGLPDHMVRKTDMGTFIDKGNIYRIPKPQELGLAFATIPERLMESFFTDHPDAFKDLGKTAWGLFTPNYTPDFAGPVIEHMTNFNQFTSRPLIPQYLEKEVPAMRYTEYTSEGAKAIGKVLGAIPLIQETDGASPVVVENYIKGWTGQLGSYALQLADLAAEKAGATQFEKPAWTVADIPFVKAFVVRNPSLQAESIQRFYDEATRIDQIMTSTKNQLKAGNDSNVSFIQQNYGEVEQKLDGFKKALSTQGRLIRSIYESDYEQHEKRQLIDSAYYQMIETARLANTMVDETKKSIKNDKQGSN